MAEHLGNVEGDVCILVALISVHAFPIIPEEISPGRAVVRESRDEMKRLTTADPKSEVGSLDRRQKAS